MREDIIRFHTPQMKTPFYLEMAGISYCDGSYKITRLDSRETVLEYVVDGRGYINTASGQYTASAGEVYILRKGTTHTYCSDAKDPWVKIFFNIRGSLADKILEEYRLGTTGKVVLCGTGLEADFRQMLAKLSDETVDQKERFESAAVDFLKIVIKLSNLDKQQSDTCGEQLNIDDEMNRLLEYIANNPKRIVGNQELANVIFRSKDYLIKRFFASFGITPYEYQLQQKFFSASNKLKNTKMSVKEIASAIGYNDQHYFSYMFKKRYGVSPTQYRKQVCSEGSKTEKQDD